MTLLRSMFGTPATVIDADDLPGGSTASSVTAELTVAGWVADVQTVTAAGVTATNIVIVAPTPADQAAYVAAGIICTTQGVDELTFTCETTPTVSIDVQAVIL